jgi:hypothetical protein
MAIELFSILYVCVTIKAEAEIFPGSRVETGFLTSVSIRGIQYDSLYAIIGHRVWHQATPSTPI